MTSKNIGWHTRDGRTGEKVQGGSFGGAIDQETVDRLVKAHFTVAYTQSGRQTFVDRNGRIVWLYLSVDPETTPQGHEARQIKRQQDEERERLYAAKKAELEDILDGLSVEEAIDLLTGRK